MDGVFVNLSLIKKKIVANFEFLMALLEIVMPSTQIAKAISYEKNNAILPYSFNSVA
jgi:hypothetical protein